MRRATSFSGFVRLCLGATIVALTLPRASGQDTVSSAPMGYVKISLAGRTDNLVNIPLLQEPVGIGPVLAVTANSVSLGDVSWTANQFAPVTTSPGATFYAEISTGQLKGLTFPIVSNTIDTLTLNTGTSSLVAHPLGTISVNDMVRIRPYWTLGTALGATDSTIAINSFNSLPSVQQVDSGDSVLFFDPTAVGIQKPPIARYAYVHSIGWRSLSDASSDQENIIIPALSPLLVRKRSAADMDLVLVGDAFQAPGCLYVPGGSTQLANDAYLALASSEPVALANTGLYSTYATQNVVNASAQASQRQDVLQVFDSSRKGYERPPEHTYFYLAGQGWREQGSGSTTIGTDVLLDPTRIYLLRKRANSPGLYWLQNGGTP